MNVVVFSLWGNAYHYVDGLFRNLELSQRYYPSWLNVVYLDKTVPIEIAQRIRNHTDTKVFDMTDSGIHGLFWRFFAQMSLAIPVERFIVRDCDSRISEREANAVDEWIKSRTVLHIMRDHPLHKEKILGGMWGLCCGNIDRKLIWHRYLAYAASPASDSDKAYVGKDWFAGYGDDQIFLRNVYKIFVHNSTIHASHNRYENHARPFPTRRVNFQYVGEQWYSERRPNIEVDVGRFVLNGAGDD